MEIRVEVKGISGHGSAPERGDNAIYKMADIIQEVRDLNDRLRVDPFLGKGNAYMHSVQGYRDGVLEQKPTLVNLQCDIDHPTQSMADMLHLIHEFGASKT